MKQKNPADMQMVEIKALDNHPSNPAVKTGVWREDVIQNIATQLLEAGEYPQEHAIRARHLNGHFQIIAGHHRTRAATTAGLTHLWAWVQEMTDADALMELALDNSQGEWSPLFYGIHALEYVELGSKGRGKKGGLREYARSVGFDHSYILRCTQAAKVLLQTCAPGHRFTDKAKHLRPRRGPRLPTPSARQQAQ